MFYNVEWIDEGVQQLNQKLKINIKIASADESLSVPQQNDILRVWVGGGGDRVAPSKQRSEQIRYKLSHSARYITLATTGHTQAIFETQNKVLLSRVDHLAVLEVKCHE